MRDNIWKLTVHYWPDAAEHGVQPVAKYGGFDDKPANYRPHEFLFQHRPQRADFLTVVQANPWTHVWEKNLLPIIARMPWPLVSDSHKRADVMLSDDAGRIVGKLEVEKEYLYTNKFKQIYSFTPRMIGEAMVGMTRKQAQVASGYIETNWIALLNEYNGLDFEAYGKLVGIDNCDWYDAGVHLLRNRFRTLGYFRRAS